MDYSLGFIIKDKKVLLVQKLFGPSFNIGKWNGVGGKIDEGEDPSDAMVRECKEEAGLEGLVWDELGTMSGEGWIVYLYWSECGSRNISTPEKNDVEEPLMWFDLASIEYFAEGDLLAQNIMTVLTHLKHGTGKINLEL
jgi:8-oxo-dGTP diphosphatase